MKIEYKMSKRHKETAKSKEIKEESSGKIKKASSKSVKLVWKDNKPIIETNSKNSDGKKHTLEKKKRKKIKEVTDKLVKKDSSSTKKDYDDSYREEEPMETDDIIMKELQLLREENHAKVQSKYTDHNYRNLKQYSPKSKGKKIVVDTNVYINDLELIKMINRNNYILVVPYIVIQELDDLKDRRSLGDDKRLKAREAINFLLSALENPKANVLFKGQDPLNDDLKKLKNDDKILFCCKSEAIELFLTDDKPLCIKASIQGLKVYRTKEFRKELLKKCKFVSVEEKINFDINDDAQMEEEEVNKQKIDEREVQLERAAFAFFRTFIEIAMKDAYDEIWRDVLTKNPTSLKRCFQLMHKHWIAVFGSLFVSRHDAKDILNDLRMDGDTVKLLDYLRLINPVESKRLKIDSLLEDFMDKWKTIMSNNNLTVEQVMGIFFEILIGFRDRVLNDLHCKPNEVKQIIQIAANKKIWQKIRWCYVLYERFLDTRSPESYKNLTKIINDVLNSTRKPQRLLEHSLREFDNASRDRMLIGFGQLKDTMTPMEHMISQLPLELRKLFDISV
ncbi:DgyrCDS103 [Dimorphilus gyrociliatus]|uniref:DgyrCDS103 n=1 Tax=Dimorphilus gyrociliatus TaxID=2664684 RepID=A0A7I8V6C6_9ANNE|nr:DgyrCDS103 [Dimorphilus gyrociliatus]